jgi:hypothetical protein
MQLLRRYPAVFNETVHIDLRIGIDASSWPDNSVINVTNGALVIEDHYKYDDETGFATVVSNKTGIAENALNAATTDFSATNWYISFSSATNTPYHTPHAIALGGTQRSHVPWVWVPGLNPNLMSFINPMLLPGGQRPKIGTVLMNFPESPGGGGLIASIIDLNG